MSDIEKRDPWWGVTVKDADGEVVTIERACLSGREIKPEDEETIRRAASHLLGFIGEGYDPEAATALSRLTRENEGWAATCSRQVERIDRLEAENEELRGLVKDAHIALSAASRQLTNDHKHVLGGKTWGGALITRLTAAMRSANRAEIAPDQDVLIVSVRLASDHFETSLRLPVKEATKEKMDEFVTRWLDLMQAGLRTGFSYMSADLKGDNANG